MLVRKASGIRLIVFGVLIIAPTVVLGLCVGALVCSMYFERHYARVVYVAQEQVQIIELGNPIGLGSIEIRRPKPCRVGVKTSNHRRVLYEVHPFFCDGISVGSFFARHDTDRLLVDFPDIR